MRKPSSNYGSIGQWVENCQLSNAIPGLDIMGCLFLLQTVPLDILITSPWCSTFWHWHDDLKQAKIAEEVESHLLHSDGHSHPWTFLNQSFMVYVSLMHACIQSLQSCLTLCNSMHCSPPGSSVHRILQARILEWVAVPTFRGSSQPKDQTHVFCIAGGLFTVWATRGALDGVYTW